jgi:hypothetical protein
MIAFEHGPFIGHRSLKIVVPPGTSELRLRFCRDEWPDENVLRVKLIEPDGSSHAIEFRGGKAPEKAGAAPIASCGLRAKQVIIDGQACGPAFLLAGAYEARLDFRRKVDAYVEVIFS